MCKRPKIPRNRSQETGECCVNGSEWVQAGAKKARRYTKRHRGKDQRGPGNEEASLEPLVKAMASIWSRPSPAVGPPLLNPTLGNRGAPP